MAELNPPTEDCIGQHEDKGDTAIDNEGNEDLNNDVMTVTGDLQVIELEDNDEYVNHSQRTDAPDGTHLSDSHSGAWVMQTMQQPEQRETSIQRHYKYPEKSSELLLHLNDQRCAKSLVDVTLVSSDQMEFPCHRAVLAASSPYFAAMFTDDLQESRSKRIQLTNITGSSLSSILHAVYVCDLEITSQAVHDLLATAHFLSYPHIVASCCQFFIESLSPQNCLGIAQFAEKYGCHELQTSAWNYTLKHFNAVSSGQEFLSLNASVMESLISSDDVHVAIEDEVLFAVLQWAKSDETHIASLPSVLAVVRLPLVSDAFLTSSLNAHHMLHGSGKNLSLIKDAQNLKELAKKGLRRDHPLLRPRHAMRSEVLVVVGGMMDTREWVPYVSCFNPKTDEWSAMASLPFDHSDYSAASVNDAIYVSGGFHRTKGTISEVWRYDEMHDKWGQVRDLIIPRFNHTSVGYDHHIYVLGGEDADQTVTDVERYSPASDTWELVGAINPTGSGMAVAPLNGKLYIIGWLTNVRLMCVVQCFDLVTRECSIIPSSGLNRQLFPAVPLNSSIFILGGNRIKEVAVYNPETYQSGKAEPMRYKRNTPSATVVGGKIYVTGGELRQHVAKAECYDPDLDLWDSVCSMPHALCFHGCVMIRKYLGPPYHQ